MKIPWPALLLLLWQVRAPAAAPPAAELVVVLDRNVFETPPPTIHEAQVDMTVLGGKVLYQR